MDAARIEALHETASSRYLQGDLEGARAAWLEVLCADPGDERALEGIRLCEQSIGSETESVCTNGRSPFAVGSGLGEELPDLAVAAAVDRSKSGMPPGELDLSEISDEIEEPAPAWTSSWQVTEEKLDSSAPVLPLQRARSSPRPAAEPASAVPPPPAHPSTPTQKVPGGWQFGDPAKAAGPTDKPKAAALTAAEIELRRRVNELIAEALRSVERGDTGAARRTVGRILILDEQNETALSLLSKLGEGDGLVGFDEGRALDEAAPTAAPESPGWERHVQDPELASAPSLGLDRAPAAAAPTPTAAPALPAFEAFGDAGEQGSFADSPLGDETLPPLEDLIGDEPAGKPASSRNLGLRFNVSRRALALSAGVLALGLLGVCTWVLLRPAGDAEPASIEARAGDRPAPEEQPDGPSSPSESPGPEAVARPAPSTATTAPANHLAAALASAERAESKGDLGALVLALAEALKLRPEDTALRERFDAAAARYRARQEDDRKWQEALQAYESGNYTHALAYFYRVPADDPRPELERYKLNGWFNLGLVALRAGDCKEAKQHLTEARQVSAADAGVKAALELAHRCSVGGDAEWTARLEQFELRGLGD